MGNFKRGGRSSGRLEMHSAICSECGKRCEVPFKPTGDKPVYCSECFSNQGGGGGRRSDRRNSGFGGKKMFEATCDKCGKRCEVPFKPTSGKPVYCSECFGQGDKGKKSPDQTGRQLEMINSKLDKILESLNLTDLKDKKVVAKKVSAKKGEAPKPEKAPAKKEFKKTTIKFKKEAKAKTATKKKAVAKKPTTKKKAPAKKASTTKKKK